MMNKANHPMDLRVENVPLLEGISSDKLHSVLRCINARMIHFKKGDLLSSRYRTDDLNRYLVEGEASCIKYDTHGIKSILYTVYPNSVITSDLLSLAEEHTPVEIVADSDCTVLEFCFSSEADLCSCCIKYIDRIRSNLVASLAATNADLFKRLDILANRSIQEKY